MVCAVTDPRTAVLYNDEFAPITSSIGFLASPLDEVADGLQRWRAEIHGSAERIPVDGGLIENVHRLEPLTGGVCPRELLVATSNPEWTAVFDCGVDGGDQVTTVGYLARTLHVQGVVVTAIPDRIADGQRADRYGALQFELFAPIMTEFLNYLRTVSLVREGTRWRFDASGTVRAYEDVSAYQARKIRERFTLEMLQKYAMSLGIDVFNESFYPGPSCLVVNPAMPPNDGLSLSLADTRRQFDLGA